MTMEENCNKLTIYSKVNNNERTQKKKKKKKNNYTIKYSTYLFSGELEREQASECTRASIKEPEIFR